MQNELYQDGGQTAQRLRIILKRLDKRLQDDAVRHSDIVAGFAELLVEAKAAMAASSWEQATEGSSHFIKHETGIFPSGK